MSLRYLRPRMAAGIGRVTANHLPCPRLPVAPLEQCPAKIGRHAGACRHGGGSGRHPATDSQATCTPTDSRHYGTSIVARRCCWSVLSPRPQPGNVSLLPPVLSRHGAVPRQQAVSCRIGHIGQPQVSGCHDHPIGPDAAPLERPDARPPAVTRQPLPARPPARQDQPAPARQTP